MATFDELLKTYQHYIVFAILVIVLLLLLKVNINLMEHWDSAPGRQPPNIELSSVIDPASDCPSGNSVVLDSTQPGGFRCVPLGVNQTIKRQSTLPERKYSVTSVKGSAVLPAPPSPQQQAQAQALLNAQRQKSQR
jgi:hypothetical protein